MKSVLNVEVSCFKNYNTPSNPQKVNLLTWLNSNKYKQKVEELRLLEDKSTRDQIKSKLPAITPSGLFSYRSEDHIIKHSGIIQIDVDGLDIEDIEIYKNELIKIKNIAYLGLSVSGKGLWGLIPIPGDPKMHKKYFDAINKTFESFGIRLDEKPKNVASLRGYSFDPYAYFNHNAILFKTSFFYPTDKLIKPAFPGSIESSNKLLNWMIREIQNAQSGERHATRLKIARLAGGYIAGGILDYGVEVTLIEAYLSQYRHIDSKQIQKKEINAIRSGISDGLKHPIKSEFRKNLSWDQIPRLSPFRPSTLEDLSIEKNVLQGKDLIFNSSNEYIQALKIENGILLNGLGYPAIWDCIKSNQFLDLKTKQVVDMINKKHELLAIIRKFNLTTC
ncbi:BT4734/BF3469 family protein [Shivajiella indica]|uniref:BT4734/BF3469 family protein n=1 Tax=Shivajiella indica TaxID=872115 RepID=A0ABW5B4V8_9BACT